MGIWDKSEHVKLQYGDDKNLSTRIKLHSKHSVNKQAFGAWLFGQYDFTCCTRILELGCGNGGQWEGRIGSLPSDATLVLSDYSEGMVDIVWEKYSSFPKVLVQRIDIQDIPFPEATFDIVIANHMLYHVPDLPRAIHEVYRVTKSEGRFYSSTNGNGGMIPYLHNAIKKFYPETTAYSETLSFNLQNGKEILGKHFSDIQQIDYVDSLRITDTQDLIDWIRSGMVGSTMSEYDFDCLYDYFEAIRVKEGSIDIPKEGGLFISRK